MGNVLVLYDSQTGHTEKMARHVLEGADQVSGTAVRLRSVDEADKDDIFWCDGIALGSPTHLGVVSWKMKRLMNYGFLVFGVTEYVANKFTLHYGAVTAGEPRRREEIAACQRLGQRLAQWVAVLVDGRKELHPGPVRDR